MRAGRYDQAFCYGAVQILDRNVLFSCGASSIFNHPVRVRTFWIVTWCFLVARAAFSIILCVCVWRGAHLDRNVVFSCGAGSISNHFMRVRVAQCTFWIVTRCFLVVTAAFSIILRLCVVLILLSFGAGHRKS